jgi:uncharacterized protein (TIGR02996 family)
VTDEAAFLRAIANAPEDDAPRLIYADWLEERGDPRAEYVRLELELHHIDERDSVRRLELELRHIDDRDSVRRFAITQRMIGVKLQLDARWMSRMEQTRRWSAAKRLHLDLAVVSDGSGLIDVRGEGEDTVLLVEGRPIALNWDDCEGSVGQYLVFTGHTRGSDYARQLTDFVSGEREVGQPFAEPLWPLLSTFANGTYWLAYTPSTIGESFDVEGHPIPSTPDLRLLQYYPAADHILIGTQPRESLDEQRIGFYREQIKAEHRPIVLTVGAEGAWCDFVIDGHHKLEAYVREEVKPSILSIIRWDAPAISLDEGIGYLPRGHAGLASYRRMKGYTPK